MPEEVMVVLCGNEEAVEHYMQNTMSLPANQSNPFRVSESQKELVREGQRVIFVTPENAVRTLTGVTYTRMQFNGPMNVPRYSDAAQFIEHHKSI